MKTVNVHEAKTHFSQRRLGLLDGKFRVPDNFNEPLPDEVIAAFEGRRR